MFFVNSDVRTTLVKVPLLQLDLLLKMFNPLELCLVSGNILR